MSLTNSPITCPPFIDSHLRAQAKIQNFGQVGWPSGLSFVLVRRMACGRWKVAGKTYRTKALAKLGAVKRGLLPVDPSAGLRPAVHDEAYLAPRSVAHARRGQVFVKADTSCTPGGRAHMIVRGAGLGNFTGRPTKDTVPLDARFEGVTHQCSSWSGLESFARLSFTQLV